MPQTIYFPTEEIHVEKAVGKSAMSYMHHHSSYELYYMLSGEREYFIENSFFKVSPGDFILIPKNMLHRTAGRGAERILVYFSDSFLESYFTKEMITALLKNFQPKVFRPNSAGQEKSRALLSALLLEYKSNPTNSTMLASYLFQLLFLISNEENTASVNTVSDNRINQILSYINENYSKIETIDEIADKHYISKYHLCRSFSKSMGMSLVSYLNTVKIRAACNMIQKGTYNMTEIALHCGFNSSTYFCKVFKMETGLSPREYKSLNHPTD